MLNKTFSYKFKYYTRVRFIVKVFSRAFWKKKNCMQNRLDIYRTLKDRRKYNKLWINKWINKCMEKELLNFICSSEFSGSKIINIYFKFNKEKKMIYWLSRNFSFSILSFEKFHFQSSFKSNIFTRQKFIEHVFLSWYNARVSLARTSVTTSQLIRSKSI